MRHQTLKGKTMHVQIPVIMVSHLCNTTVSPPHLSDTWVLSVFEPTYCVHST